MRQVALASLMIVAATFQAHAADQVISEPVAVYDWTGAYIGAQIGYGGARTNVAELDNYSFSDFGDTQFRFHANGFIGGVYGGYNWQLDQAVFGLEADVYASGIKKTVANTMWPGSDESFSTKIDWFGTLRARAGYAADRFLPYVTGGAAFANVKSSYDDNDFVPGNHAAASGVVWGWTVGAGAEYAVTDNWILKAEYLYLDLGKRRGSFDDGAFRYDFDSNIHTVKIGASYKF